RPDAEAFAKIAVEIDRHGSSDMTRSLHGSRGGQVCHVLLSNAFTAVPAILAFRKASLMSVLRTSHTRSGSVRNKSAIARASVCASATVTALNRKPRPTGIWAKR